MAAKNALQSECPVLLVIFFFFLLLIQASSGAEASSKFIKMASGFFPSYGLLAQASGVRSTLECAGLCSARHFRFCRSYGYCRASRDCHVFSEDYQSKDLAEPVPRCNFYSMCSKNRTIHYPCCSDQDCVVANTECRDGVCQCVVGYHYHPNNNSCDEKCSSYGTGYYRINNYCLDGHNDRSDWNGISFQQCYNWCLSDPKCRTFEHSDSRCFLSYSTKLEAAQAAWKWCEVLSYHQRDCA